VARADLVWNGGVAAHLAHVLRKRAEVTGVGVERVRREGSLDAEVIQVRVDPPF
jgi:hypothetical protein